MKETGSVLHILGLDRFKITDLIFIPFFVAMYYKMEFFYQSMKIIRNVEIIIPLSCVIMALILIGIKNRFVAWVYYLALSALMFADVAYNNYYFRYLSVGMLRAVKFLFSVRTSVDSAVKSEFYWMFADAGILLILVIADFVIRRITARRKKLENDSIISCDNSDYHETTVLKKIAVFFTSRFSILLAMVLIFVIVINPMGNTTLKSVANQEFMSYHTKDVLEATGIYKDIEWKNELNGSIMKYEEEKNVPLFGVAKGRNLIVIQIESFMNFLINQKYNGQELTPNINRLLKDDTIYFDNYYQEVSAGNTSDSEFATNNSIYGTINSFTYEIYQDNHYKGLPWILREHGYETAVFHAYKKDFWNRDKAYPNLGFQRYDSRGDFKKGEKIGMGLSDEDMFDQVIEKMKHQREPFYDFIITLTNHYPYYMPYDKYNIELKKVDKNTTFGHYLNSAHYTDYCIGKFIKKLKKEKLYKNSIIAMYGDHTGLTKADLLIKKSMDRYLQHEYDYDVMLNIPLMIHIPDKKRNLEQKINTTGGNLDFMPTIAALMGIDKLDTFYLGHNLLYVKDNLVANQYYMPKGSFIKGDIIYVMSRDGVFEHGRAFDKNTREKIPLEQCRDYYKKSTAIINASEEILEKDKLRGKYEHYLYSAFDSPGSDTVKKH